MRNKKTTWLAAALCFIALFGAAGAGEFTPAGRVTVYITSNPGSNSDIFVRNMGEAIKQLGVPFNMIMINKVDGGQAIGNRLVSEMRAGRDADNTLLGYNIGDVPFTLHTTDMTMDDFKQLAIICSEKHILYTGKNSRFKTFKDVVDTLDKEPLVLAGGRGDDFMFFHSFKRGIDTKDHLTSLLTGGSNETAIQVLGEHVDLGIGKPAVLTSFIENGDFRPLAVEGDTRLAPPFDDVPTFAELGYPQIGFVQSRGFFGGKNMSPAAVAYWSDLLTRAAALDYFKVNYLDKFNAEVTIMGAEEARKAYYKAQEDSYDSGFGKRK